MKIPAKALIAAIATVAVFAGYDGAHASSPRTRSISDQFSISSSETTQVAQTAPQAAADEPPAREVPWQAVPSEFTGRYCWTTEGRFGPGPSVPIGTLCIVIVPDVGPVLGQVKS